MTLEMDADKGKEPAPPSAEGCQRDMGILRHFMGILRHLIYTYLYNAKFIVAECTVEDEDSCGNIGLFAECSYEHVGQGGACRLIRFFMLVKWNLLG